MSYCPNCRHEYADSVERCLECGRILQSGRPPAPLDLDVEDLVIPGGATVCGMIALVMLYLRIATQSGWITGPIADTVQFAQPPCMTAFYAFAVVACVVTLAFWVFRVIIRREL